MELKTQQELREEHFEDLRIRMVALRDALGDGLPAVDQVQVSELLDANEFGVALEWIVDTLTETKRAPSESVARMITALALKMEMYSELLSRIPSGWLGPETALFYPVEVRWSGRSVFLLWRTSGEDAYVDEPGRLLTRESLSHLEEYCAPHGLNLEDRSSAPMVIDLDELQRFVHGRADPDAEALLNSWNFFLDVATTHESVALRALDERLRETYGALFARTSAGVMVRLSAAPPSEGELAQLREMMAAGLAMMTPLLRAPGE